MSKAKDLSRSVSRRTFVHGASFTGLLLTSKFLSGQTSPAAQEAENKKPWENANTTAQALASWKQTDDPCAVVRRTQVVKILNTSGCGIVIAFQKLDSSYVPSGYEPTTGVYPACQNIPPATNCLTDPCRSQVASPRLPIAAEVANCSVKFTCNGQEHDVNCDQQVAPAGKYFVTVGWSFVPGLTKDAVPKVKFSSETADLPKEKN
jgi:hypothetical protein